MSGGLKPQYVLFLWISCLAFAKGGKLLVVPQDGSHWLSMHGVLQEMHRRGHEIMVVAPAVSLYITEAPFYNLTQYPVPFHMGDLESHFRQMNHEVFEKLPLLEKFFKRMESVRNVSTLFLSACSHLVNNRELMTHLGDNHFDAVFTDPFLPCGPIVAKYLSLPAVYFLHALPCSLDYLATQCPSPPSYVPQGFSGSTDRMTFLQRVKNMLLKTFCQFFLSDFVYSPYTSLASELLKTEVTVTDLLSYGSIWLLRSDFAKDFPRPTMPNIVFIGGINCAYTKPLSPEFEAYVNASGEHGVVIFSLGSMVSEIPMAKSMEIAEALGTIPQTVRTTLCYSFMSLGKA
ncbi:UDP-glucuronosyltransferase 1A1-like isoform X2 [Notamacropus eugenii]|uniref:UDP-glucuronosyltransferase 1A1-like isoform X2 n=1 Tax=Notamacropus eugenii TaxID=9315 RepID=UPI003B677A5D